MSYRQLEPPTQRMTPVDSTRVADLTPDIRRFKAAYVLERRIFERMRDSRAATYFPSRSLDGKAKYSSMERSAPKNQWAQMYAKLCRSQPLIPWQYVRVLFSALRFTDAPVPQVTQLASEANLSLVGAHLMRVGDTLDVQSKAEYQRANRQILLLQKGCGHSFEKAVYYALVDRDLGLSPLFVYSLATAAVAASRLQPDQSPACALVVEKLAKIAQESEYLAALDYAVFPDLFDQLWGSRIPDRLRLVAPDILASALSE